MSEHKFKVGDTAEFDLHGDVLRGVVTEVFGDDPSSVFYDLECSAGFWFEKETGHIWVFEDDLRPVQKEDCDD